MFGSSFLKKTDEELMRLLQEGEGKALTTLYNRYSRQMVRYFYRMLWRDDNKAQDFLHDLFVRIIERPGLFNTEKKFSTWLYSVAHNMCKNEYRKQGFRAAVEKTLRVDLAAESSVSDQMDRNDFVRGLERAMKSWPEEDRSLFVFRHELEMPFGEIAAILQCPEGTVRSRWFYLRKELAQNFQQFQVLLKVI